VRRLLVAAVAGGLVALATATGSPAQAPNLVGITNFPQTINSGQTVTISGFVSGAPGIDVTVRRYTTLHCTGTGIPVTVLTAGSNGSFTFTRQLAVNPPVAFGFISGLAANPSRKPDFNHGDACVNIGAGARLSATSQGSVTVDGTPFKSGVIGYGSTVDLGKGAAVNLSADSGSFKFYPASGQSSSFVPVRVALPVAKGKKKQKRQYVIEVRLSGGNLASCKQTKKTQGFRTESTTTKPPVRSLWGNGKGNYRTRGRYSSATVLGTIWLVQDGCNGTLTVVRRGKVLVVDFAKNKRYLVKAGQSYLAKPR
jgi:hypothetical protein